MTSRERILILFLKEMRDALRDRRTIFTMLFLPVLLYPLLIVTVIQMHRMHARSARQRTLNIGYAVRDPTPPATAAAIDASLIRRLDGLPQVAARAAPEMEAEARGEVVDGKLDALVIFPRDLADRLARLEQTEVVVFVDEAESRSNEAGKLLAELLRDVGKEALTSRLTALGHDAAAAAPLLVRTENVATPEKMGGYLLGSLFAYLLLFVTMLGAYYPAIDLGAGERERGTLETLVVSPLERWEICVGKFLAVFTFSTATAVLNLLSLAATFRYGLALGKQGADALGGLGLRIDASVLALIPLMIIPYSALFSALMLFISFFAKTFKEAQTYLSPIMLLMLLPMIAMMLPGTRLSPVLIPVPVLNLCLLFKDVLVGKGTVLGVLGVIGTNTAYALLLLGLAMRAFTSESIGGGASLRAALWRSVRRLPPADVAGGQS
ncbi:MAG: ABC transporter permease [Candidatus Schekmanbacteria bacterium]|nr:ABC transporter permease [Candidatus Schekmanbacteria bacterium]